MKLEFYNSLTKKKEPFQPIHEGEIRIYTCGVTVYDRCHLGHARGAINFDVMRRFLQAVGYKVTYVKNYTDIDDKMIERANARGITVDQLATEMIEAHDKDMESLGIHPPDIAPKATEHIPEILAMIEKLIEGGYAYEIGGDVFFRVRRFEEYGKLSGKNLEDLIAGSRVEVMDSKEDPLDFALWKSAKPNEPTWDSPWGKGRPGWHIECSAMSQKYLGETFDIHAGGSDLIFPHHENEIAQSECSCHKPFVNLWMHNGMIKIQDQKMSKSLGNFATIEDLVQIYHPELIRFFILQSQYRASVNFSKEGLASAQDGLDRIYGALAHHLEGKGSFEPGLIEPSFAELGHKKQEFVAAMADDLNTPQAIAVLFELTRMMNSSKDQAFQEEAHHLMVELGALLGLLEADPRTWFQTPRIKGEEGQGLSDEQIEALIAERKQARTDKNWGRADEIRDLFKEAGIALEDKPDGTTIWKRN